MCLNFLELRACRLLFNTLKIIHKSEKYLQFKVREKKGWSSKEINVLYNITLKKFSKRRLKVAGGRRGDLFLK